MTLTKIFRPVFAPPSSYVCHNNIEMCHIYLEARENRPHANSINMGLKTLALDLAKVWIRDEITISQCFFQT